MRKIDYSGFTWCVKEGTNLAPGGNTFSSLAKDVFTDSRGLHLRIRRFGDSWLSSEIYTEEFAKWGEYTFFVSTNVEKFDKNIVVGLFIYQDDQHELDIEFHNMVASYSIQPEFTKKYKLNLQGDYSTHKIYFSDFNTVFESTHGHYDNNPNNKIFKLDTLKGNRLQPRKSHLHLNFWLKNGKPPTDRKDAELIIKSVGYRKLL